MKAFDAREGTTSLSLAKTRSERIMRDSQDQVETSQIRSLQLFGAIESKPTTLTQWDKGLMYLNAKINGKVTQAIVDTGASHNFINVEEAKRLGLKLDKGQGLMKTVNTKAKPIDGMA
ncbi:hypothetical protein CsSME_00004067 [Camellia sinensis var. sinensis]